jgi:hypothetical protein
MMTVLRQRTVPLPTPRLRMRPCATARAQGSSPVIPGSLVTALQERGERLCRCVVADADGRAHARRYAELGSNGIVLSRGAVRKRSKFTPSERPYAQARS